MIEDILRGYTHIVFAPMRESTRLSVSRRHRTIVLSTIAGQGIGTKRSLVSFGQAQGNPEVRITRGTCKLRVGRVGPRKGLSALDLSWSDRNRPYPQPTRNNDLTRPKILGFADGASMTRQALRQDEGRRSDHLHSRRRVA
jgi:hypothetical protein